MQRRNAVQVEHHSRHSAITLTMILPDRDARVMFLIRCTEAVNGRHCVMARVPILAAANDAISPILVSQGEQVARLVFDCPAVV